MHNTLSIRGFFLFSLIIAGVISLWTNNASAQGYPRTIDVAAYNSAKHINFVLSARLFGDDDFIVFSGLSGTGESTTSELIEANDSRFFEILSNSVSAPLRRTGDGRAELVALVTSSADGADFDVALTLTFRNGDKKEWVEQVRGYQRICAGENREQFIALVEANNARFYREVAPQIRRAIDQNWSGAGIDDAFDQAMRDAATQLNNEGNTFGRNFATAFNVDYAKRQGERMMNIALQSSGVQNAFQTLSEKVVSTLEPQLETQVRKNLSDVTSCAQGLLESSFNDERMIDVFSLTMDRSIESGSVATALGIDDGVTSGGPLPAITIVGLGLIIASRVGRAIGRRLSQTLVTRLGARIASRFIPIIGWAALAFDVFNMSSGKQIESIAELIIETPEVRSEMRQVTYEITNEELRTAFDSATSEIVLAVTGEYDRVVKSYEDLFSLARREQSVSVLLRDADARQFYRLAAVRAALSESMFLSLAGSGAALSVLDLPEDRYLAALKIVEFYGDGEILRQWLAKAEALLPRALRGELYQFLDVREIEADVLRRVLRIEKIDVALSVATLPPEMLPTVMRFDDEMLNRLALGLDGRALWNQVEREQNFFLAELLSPFEQESFLTLLGDRATVSFLISERASITDLSEVERLNLLEDVQGLSFWNAPSTWVSDKSEIVKKLATSKYRATWIIFTGVWLLVIMLSFFVSTVVGLGLLALSTAATTILFFFAG